MRVVAGRLGGRRLIAPRGAATRPTSDRVREALFSILGDVVGLRVLDLYAGSGALAIEALSRGAASAVLVDSSAAAVSTIKRNLGELGIEIGVDAQVHRQDALRYLHAADPAAHAPVHAARIDRPQYDLVLLDPPYGQTSNLGRELTAALTPVLAPGARVVTESDRRAPLELALSLQLQRRYGDTLIHIYFVPT